ncbi:IS5 family transposase [Dehalococcoidia bacterium]|nr:IS5 family transposase [Dehalococcoidia bacterium]
MIVRGKLAMIKEKKPDRDWKEYNEHLVRRGEVLLDVESLQGWQEELQGMNLGKNGRPFRYPHSLILFLGTLRVVFSLPYRQLEGFARKLGKLISIPAPDYSTLSLRIPKLDLDPDLGYEPREGETVVIAVDGTGIKVTNRGEWMRRKRKGYIKIHVGVDIGTKQVVSLEMTDDRTHDSEKLVPLVKGAQRKVKVKRVLGDGGYDTHDNFKFLAACGIEPGIKVREDSNPNCGGQREEVVQAYLRGPPEWKKQVGYGQRWMAETFFSGFKRLFGEVVSAKKFERMVKEIKLKVWVYNLMLGLPAAPALSAAAA